MNRGIHRRRSWKEIFNKCGVVCKSESTELLLMIIVYMLLGMLYHLLMLYRMLLVLCFVDYLRRLDYGLLLGMNVQLLHIRLMLIVI